MAVAVALLAFQAMAMAPVIGNIPSPVVGNAENATPANGFVYPDAIDLTKYVTDQESNSAQIIWSYTTATTAKYSINGKAPLDISGGDNPVVPGAKSLNGAVSGGEADFDSNPLTITIRNIDFSPTPGQVGTGPSSNDASGVIDSETQAVTLFASDATTYTMKSVWFYTEVGRDRLSPGGEETYHWRGENSTGWTYSGLAGSLTSSYDSTGQQVCMTTTAGNTNQVGTWRSPYGDHTQATLALVDNAVYHIRAVVNSSQTNVDKCPLFDMTVNNFNSVNGTTYGQNAYGANFFILSNVGGANAPTQKTGGTEYNFWWTPSAVSLSRWKDTSETQPGLFAPSNLDQRNAFVEFRILQTGADASLAINSVAEGTFCLKDLFIERFDMNAMQLVGSPLYNVTSITNSASGGTTRVSTGNFTSNFASGSLVIQSTQAGTQAGSTMLALVEPGDTNIDYTQANTLDNYPCQYDNQTLYLVTVGLHAPQQSDMDSPPYMFWVGADTLTNENIQLSWVSLNAWHHAMPSIGASQSYKAFFYSNYGTLNSNDPQFSWWHIFRPRFMVGNQASGEAMTGAISIDSMRVDKVVF